MNIKYYSITAARCSIHTLQATPQASQSFAILFRYITVFLLLSLAGCTANNQSTQTSTTAPLLPALRVSGSGTGLPIVEKLAQAYAQKYPETKFQFESGTNTGGAIQGVIQGTLDLAVANRPLSASEAKQALNYYPFAKDAIAFVTHQPNPLKNIASSQVRNIYSGKLTNWQQLGGASEPIIVLDRDPDESARKFVLVPFMQGQPVKAQTVVLGKAKEMLQGLETTPNAIGYSSLGLLHLLPIQNVQILKLDGITPNAEGLNQGKYAWYLTLGLIHRHNPPPRIQGFINFVQGAEASQILKEYSYGVVKP